MKTARPLPYDDVVPYDKIRDYVYRKTRVMLPPRQLRRLVNARELRTIERPRRFGGGIFTRKQWLDEFIKANS